MPAELLTEVKNYLDITWTDENADSKLSSIILRAINTLNSYAGASIDFSEETEAKQLLFDCVRYISNNAFEHFKINFASELIALRAKHQVDNINDMVDYTTGDGDG